MWINHTIYEVNHFLNCQMNSHSADSKVQKAGVIPLSSIRHEFYSSVLITDEYFQWKSEEKKRSSSTSSSHLLCWRRCDQTRWPKLMWQRSKELLVRNVQLCWGHVSPWQNITNNCKMLWKYFESFVDLYSSTFFHVSFNFFYISFAAVMPLNNL